MSERFVYARSLFEGLEFSASGVMAEMEWEKIDSGYWRCGDWVACERGDGEWLLTRDGWSMFADDCDSLEECMDRARDLEHD